MLDYEALRRRMVDHQIRPSEVTDHDLVSAFLSVPRERFVEPEERPFAYGDRELRMSRSAPHRHMMPPVQLARLVQALPLGADAKALVIGCGTGYSAALLARLFGTVIAVEEDEALAAIARQRLQELGAANVRVVHARLTDGYPADAAYDGILIDGAVEVVPAALIRQLRAGGLLAAIEHGDEISRAMLFERVGDDAAKWPLFEAWAVLLPGFARPREFVF